MVSYSRASVEKALKEAGFSLGPGDASMLQTDAPQLMLPCGSSYSWEDWQELMERVENTEMMCAMHTRPALA